MTKTEMTWYARHASLSVCDKITTVTINSATGLYVQVTGGANPVTMDTLIEKVSINPGAMDIDVINTLGAAQKVNEKRPEMCAGTMDLVYSDTSKALMARLYGAAVYSAPPITTFQGGDKAVAANHRQRCAIGFRLGDGTYFDDALLNNAYIKKLTDFGIAGDDYGKATIEFGCLAQDFYTQDNLGDA